MSDYSPLLITAADANAIHKALWHCQGRDGDIRVIEKFFGVGLFQGSGALEQLLQSDPIFKANILRIMNEFIYLIKAYHVDAATSQAPAAAKFGTKVWLRLHRAWRRWRH